MHSFLADRKVTIEDISKQLGISVDANNRIVHDDLPFSNFSCCWVSLGQCKASYYNKNSRNHQLVCWEQLLHPPYSPDLTQFWFLLVWPHQRISVWNKIFKWWWSDEQHEQMAKNQIQRFLCRRNACFLEGKCLLKNGNYIEKWSQLFFSLGEMWVVKLQNLFIKWPSNFYDILLWMSFIR